ncbi:MAG: molybdopterin-guanine dinucleotide biosynthesis protein B [Methylococcales bacterium]
MYNAQIPLLGFAAASGTGKTTLLSQLIPLLKQNGLRIGVIKNSHHNFDIDQPGKDSHQLRKAGAATVLLVSPYRRAIITEFTPIKEPCLAEQLKALDQSALDLILVEGFKHEAFPKIELHRSTLNNPLLYTNDTTIIAIASDIKLNIPNSLTLLDINQIQTIAAFILNQFLNNHD